MIYSSLRKKYNLKRLGESLLGVNEEPDADSFGSSPLIGGELLGSYKTTQALGRWLTFPPKLARAIGMEEAVFLLNFMFLASEEEDWVERTSSQLEQETTLTYKQQTRVRDRLVSLGLLEVRTNRRDHQTFYRVVEERYDALVALIRRKREFDELTFGRNSTLPKVNSTNLPKGSSLLREEEVQELKKEEAPLPLCKEERRALPKPVKEPKVRKGFQRTLPAKREYVPPPKPPDTWNWFAKLWHRYTEVFPISRPEQWESLDKLYSAFSKEPYLFPQKVIEERLSRWLEQRGGKITAWASINFLEECPLMTEEGSGGDIPLIVNEE